MKPPKRIVKKYAGGGSVNDLNDAQKEQYYALPEGQREQFLKDTLASMGKVYTPMSNPSATAAPAQMVSNPASTTGTADITTKAVNVATQTASNIAQRNAAQKAAELAVKKGAETAATSAAGTAASTAGTAASAAGSVASAVPWAAVGEVGGDIVRSTGTQTGSDTSVYATNMGADALTRAGQGAALGSLIPGVGTAVGAIVGGAAGLIEGAYKSNKQTKINAENRNAEKYNQGLKSAGKGVYAKGGKVNTSQYDSYVDYLNSQYATNSSYSTGAAGEQNKQEMLSERFGDQRFNPPTKLKAGGKLPTPMTRSGMNPDFTAIPGYGDGGETGKREKKIKKPAKTIEQALIGMGIGAPLGLMGGAAIGGNYGEKNAPYGDIPTYLRTTPQVDERAAFITKNNLLGMGIGTLSSGLLGAGIGAVKGAIENSRYKAQQDRYHKAAKIARDLKAAEDERMLLQQSVEKVRQNQLKMNPDVNPENLPIDEEAKQKYLEELNLRRGGEGNKSKQMYREQMIDSGAFFGAADGGTINAKYTKKPKGTMPYPTMAKGGEISGPGGPKDDAISATVEEGSFIVPAENASIAEYIRAKYLKKPTEKANLAQGGKSTSDVMLSDGEHMFTKAEVDKLTKMGINLDELAPNSNPENKLQYGGAIALKNGGKINMAKGGLLDMEYLKDGGRKNKKLKKQLADSMPKDFSNYMDNGFLVNPMIMDALGDELEAQKDKKYTDKEIADIIGDPQKAAIIIEKNPLLQKKLLDIIEKGKNSNLPNIADNPSDILEMMPDKERGEEYIKRYIKSVKDNTVVAKKYAEGKMTTAEFLKKSGWTDNLFKTTNAKQQKAAADNMAKELISGTRLSDAEAQLQDYKKVTQSKDIPTGLIDELTYTPLTDAEEVNKNKIVADAKKRVDDAVNKGEIPNPKDIELMGGYGVSDAEEGSVIGYDPVRDRAQQNLLSGAGLTDEERTALGLATKPGDIPAGTEVIDPNILANIKRYRESGLKGKVDTAIKEAIEQGKEKYGTLAPESEQEIIKTTTDKVLKEAEPQEEPKGILGKVAPYEQDVQKEGFDESEYRGADPLKKKWYQNENLTDIGLLASLGQIGTGLYSTMASKRPIDEITPEYADAIANAQVSAKTGYTPAERAKLETDIEMTRRSGADMSGQMAGGNTATAMANIRAGNIDAANSLIKVASEDAALKRQNQEFATGLLGKLDARKRQIFTDSLDAYNQTQEAGANLLGAGIDNLVKRQRSKQWEKFLKEDLKKAGTVNLNIE